MPNRFRFVGLLLAIALVAGCGEDFINQSDQSISSPNSATSLNFPTSGLVQSPQKGFPLSTLSLRNANAKATVSDAGAFTISDLASGGGQLVFVQDASDNVVYAAFLENGEIIGSRTTAQVLIYFGSGGFALPPNLQNSYRQQIFNLPEVAALQTAIETSLATDIASLTTSPEVKSALQSAIASMRLRAASTAAANKLFINPSNGQSGIVPTERGVDQLVLTNSFRRPAWAFVTKVATTPADGGAPVPVSPPVPVTNFEIPAIKGAATFSSATVDAAIVAFGIDRAGPIAGEPVSTTPVTLPTDSQNSIKYSLEIVGPGLQSPSPTNPEQQQKMIDLTLRYAAEVIINFVVNVVLNAPAVSGKIDSLHDSMEDFSFLVNDFVKLMVAIKPEIADKAAAGDLDGVLKSMYDIVVGSSTSQALVSNFVTDKLAPFLGQQLAYVEREQFSNAVRSLMNVTAGVDLVLTSADTVFAGSSIASSGRYVQFDITTLATKIILTPLDSNVNKDGEVQFTATVPSLTLEQNQFLEYHWTCSGKAGTLRGPTGSGVNDFTTATSTGPTYKADGSGTTDTISVTLTLVDSGGQRTTRTEIGTTSTTVTVGPKLTVSVQPTSAQIGPSADSVAISVVVDGAQPGDRFIKIWSYTDVVIGALVDTQGNIIPFETELSTVTYKIGKHPNIEKTDKLSVFVFKANPDGSRGELVDSVLTNVTIQPEICVPNGTFIRNGCNLDTAVSDGKPGDLITISFTEATGISFSPCGGAWEVRNSMPGEWVSFPGGTLSAGSVRFPSVDAPTGRSLTFRLSGNPAAYKNYSLCPKPLGSGGQVGPYITITNGPAHDEIPYTVTP
jgi:hypothetical protein